MGFEQAVSPTLPTGRQESLAVQPAGTSSQASARLKEPAEFSRFLASKNQTECRVAGTPNRSSDIVEILISRAATAAPLIVWEMREVLPSAGWKTCPAVGGRS